MGTRDVPLSFQLEVILGKDRDRWPTEARFIEAAHHGDVRDIKKIAKELDVRGHGFPVTVASTTYMGMNALHAAGGSGRLPAYWYLVEEVKMDVNKPDTSQNCTPVEHAINYGNLPAVRYLLDRGADLHQKRSGNITLLHSAAVRGQSEIVKFLLSRGADVDALAVTGTPLALAAFKGHASTIKILLQHKADPNKGWGAAGDLLPLLQVRITGGRPPELLLLRPLDDNFVKTKMSDLKRQADEAFKKQDYLDASVFYTQALKLDNFDAKLLSNRSLCWLRMGNGERACDDAYECKKLRPKWAKAHYRQGAALMFMKDYASAYQSLSRALELDPESEEIEKLFWEAMERR